MAAIAEIALRFGNFCNFGDFMSVEKFLQLQSTGPEVESAKQLIEAAKQAPAASKAKSK